MTDLPPPDKTAAGLPRRAFLAPGAAPTVLAGTPASLPQDRGVDGAGPGIEVGMANTIKLNRLDGSILLIGIERQESNRINFSTVIGLGRAFHTLDHDDALRVGVLYADGSDFVQGIIDP